MTTIKKIPLSIAIIISINIVIGGGFFISANSIFKTSGLLAPLTWIICGLLLLPLVSVLASLSRLYPTAGGMYVYSKKNLGDFWGFISGWGYFIGTVAGNAMILHAFSSLSRNMGFVLPMSQIAFDITLTILFTGLNLLNITIFEKMHIGFTILKMIPIGLVFVSMFFLFDFGNLQAAPIQTSGLLESMPIVLFAYIGIEACCAIAHQIKGGERNSAKAMLISLGIIVAIYSIVQFGLLGIVGTQSANPFFDIIPKFTQNKTIISLSNSIIKISILSSYLGGFYGMFYANSWNLFAIAKEKKILFSNHLIKLNKHNTPWISVFFQGTLIVLLLLVSSNSIETLMTMSGFGVVIAYILSTITYLFINKGKNRLIGILALAGCAALLVLCINDLANDGLEYLLPFLGILLSGVILHKIQDLKFISPLRG